MPDNKENHRNREGDAVQNVSDRGEFLKLSTVFVGGAVLGGTGFLAGCGGDDEDGAQTPGPRKSIEEEPGNLQVFTWRGFEDEALWQPYKEKFSGKPPTFSFIEADDQAFARVRAGFKPDLAQPSVGHAQDYLNIETIQSWDTSLIQNFGDMRPELLEYGQIDGNQYSLPTDFGFHAPLYRTDLVEPEEESWGLIFDDRYAGKIAWYDNAGDFLMVGGMYLGVDDPLNMTGDELEDVKAFLIEKKRIVRNFTTSPTDVAADLQQGNLVVAMGLSYVFVELLGKGVDVAYMQPKEGRVSWSDGFILMSETENFHHAHEYVSAWLSKESGQYELDTFGLVPLNSQVSLENLDQSVVAGLGIDDPNVFVPPKAQFLGHIEKRREYGQTWDEIKAA